MCTKLAMSTKPVQFLIASLLSAFIATVQADDLDIYSGITKKISSPSELIFAIDTSTSMACGLNQTYENNDVGCFFNINPQLMTPQNLQSLNYVGYTIPNDVKINTVKNVLTSLLNNNKLLTDKTRVGLAFYNEPGASIVQPVRELDAASGLPAYPKHRDALLEQVKNIPLQGSTPILATLLEIGQYLTAGPIVSGNRRLQTDRITLSNFPWKTLALKPLAITSGQSVRISHPDTINPATGKYTASANCEMAVNQDPFLGQSNSSCVSEAIEALPGQIASYNESINTVDVCSNQPNLKQKLTTTQIVLVTDGVATDERLHRSLNNARMATWVKRFVTGDQSTGNFLKPGDGFNQSAADFPETAKFEDIGCPLTANSDRDQPPGNKINVDTDADGIPDLASDFGILDSQLTFPEQSLQAQQYQSCLYNVANRFRELGVKIHVIGFDIGDAIDNSKLRKISEITGGKWLSTKNAEKLKEFLSDVATSSQQTAALSVPLSPAVSVNPGVIQGNGDEVYYPMFKFKGNQLAYGNLKKYKLAEKTVAGVKKVVLVDKNNNPATESCTTVVNNKVTGNYTCFKSTSQDFWSDVTDGTDIAKGGIAGQQGIYGKPAVSGERHVYIQNPEANSFSQRLQTIDLISAHKDPLLNLTADGLGTPDNEAELIEASGINDATKAYYASLVVHPDDPNKNFANFAALKTYADDNQKSELLRDLPVYSMIRWLNGFDEVRFDADGIYNGNGPETETSLLKSILDLKKSAIVKKQDLSKSRLLTGAMIHSQPTVVNYGFEDDSQGNRTYKNTLYISGNDGFLRSIDAATGKENFSFFPFSLTQTLPTMFKNPKGKLSYGLDASWTPWRQDVPVNGVFDGQIKTQNDKDFVRLYGGMRRGGSSYYFLDVTDNTQPFLLKEINRSSTDFERLGQTWSQPVLARIKKPGDTLPTVVAIFAGGYDPAYDVGPGKQPVGSCSETVGNNVTPVICGNQIYIVEAGGYESRYQNRDNIGDVLWWASNYGTASGTHAIHADMQHSIPATVKTIDVDGDGLTDRIYVGDLGGQVFRITINNNADASLKNKGAVNYIAVSTLAQVGKAGIDNSKKEDNRGFFETPGVAVMKNAANQKYVGVALASGWREQPFDTLVNDEFYFFRDQLSASNLPATIKRPATSSQDFILNIQSIPDGINFNNAKAIAYPMNADNNYEGEKSFGSPVILFGNVFYLSYLPPTAADINNAKNSCNAPASRSRITWFRTQSGSEDIIQKQDGSIVKGSIVKGDASPTVYQMAPQAIVPMSGLGVHVGDNKVSILAGAKAIDVPMEASLEKTQWRHLGNGKAVIPAHAVGKQD